MLTAKIEAMGLPEGQVGTFYAPYVTGGIFGVYASGTPAAAASTMEAAVAELKAIATGSTTTVDSNKSKVDTFVLYILLFMSTIIMFLMFFLLFHLVGNSGENVCPGR